MSSSHPELYSERRAHLKGAAHFKGCPRDPFCVLISQFSNYLNIQGSNNPAWCPQRTLHALLATTTPPSPRHLQHMAWPIVLWCLPPAMPFPPAKGRMFCCAGLFRSRLALHTQALSLHTAAWQDLQDPVVVRTSGSCSWWQW